MDDGCVGFGEWLEIDQANGGEETEATGQWPGKEASSVQCVAGRLHLLLSVQHAWPAKRSFLISYFIQLYNYYTNLP